MKTIEIKNRFTGDIIFSHECDDNTILITLLEAIKNNANLRNANLRNANLRNADLRNADLRNANLSNANLWNADLWNADLRNADLRNADLRNANLSNANLWNADLWNADLRNADLRNANLWNADLRNADLRDADLRDAKGIDAAYMPIYYTWSLAIKGDYIRIGCKEKTVEEWDKWFESEEVYETERGTEAFARIEASYKAYKAYYLTMKEFNNKQNEEDI